MARGRRAPKRGRVGRAPARAMARGGRTRPAPRGRAMARGGRTRPAPRGRTMRAGGRGRVRKMGNGGMTNGRGSLPRGQKGPRRGKLTINGNQPIHNTPCGIGSEPDAFGGCHPYGS